MVSNKPSQAITSLGAFHLSSLMGYTQRNNSIWLGIPYAQAPINELRWKAPREVIAWEGLLE
ncbi:MAG: carboxylesterase family protein, partial [Woeseiaceae bacterium]|nr:carboxylesterase family protein [Woeseiaceae bacterium]